MQCWCLVTNSDSFVSYLLSEFYVLWGSYRFLRHGSPLSPQSRSFTSIESLSSSSRIPFKGYLGLEVSGHFPKTLPPTTHCLLPLSFPLQDPGVSLRSLLRLSTAPTDAKEHQSLVYYYHSNAVSRTPNGRWRLLLWPSPCPMSLTYSRKSWAFILKLTQTTELGSIDPWTKDRSSGANQRSRCNWQE